MTYKIQLTAQAKADIKTNRDWYEERATGLGEKFTTEVNERIESLRDTRVEHKVIYKQVRRIMLYRFPYTIYYIRDEQKLHIKILAVLYNRQSINIIKDR